METPNHQILEIFNIQKSNTYKLSVQDRLDMLDVLMEAIELFEDDIKEALHNDLRKHPIEATLAEIFPLIQEIKIFKKNLKSWAKPEPVKNNLVFKGSEGWLVREPWGQCLIISPWNYPIQLPLLHLISSIAAGNRTIIKPSEIATHSSKVLKEIIESVFPEDWVAVIEGGVETTTQLLQLPFNHIHFTGSTEIGKVIMRSAATHLASCTLELGGKSPFIIDDKYDMRKAVKKIILGKCFNLGQTCIAPDYILVPENRKYELIEVLSATLDETFGDDIELHPQLSRIINKKHFLRVKSLYDEALNNGAVVHHGGIFIEDDLFISPTIISDIDTNSKLLNEEIFGPLIPIVTFKTVMEARDFINSRPKPLAMYLFSDDNRWAHYFSKNTSAGALLINDVMIHIMHPHLPFGGANASGLGYSTGKYGFDNFSHIKPILKVNPIFSPSDIMNYPHSMGLKLALPLLKKI